MSPANASRTYLVLFVFALLAAALACGPLGGTEPGGEAGPTAIPSPTLAPTTTADANATPLPTVPAEPTLAETGSGESDSSPDSGEPGTSTATGESGSGTGDSSQAGGDAGSDGSPSSGSSGSAGPAACPAGGQNLLANPSFEGPYEPYGAIKEINHAKNWIPWWEDDGKVNFRPEYKPADVAVAANRVHSGSMAQQYFKSFGQFKAGLQQTVLNIPAGSRVQFSAYGQAWSCEEFSQCPGGTSFNPANMLMRVGIDPKGGTDWRSKNVVWSAYFNPLDQWQVACVEAVAGADKVTVFTWASPDGPRQNQDVYWDDASLVVLP